MHVYLPMKYGLQNQKHMVAATEFIISVFLISYTK